MRHPVRCDILRFLRRSFPNTVAEQSILAVFYTSYSADQIDQALGYCADKRYVERREVPHPWIEARTVALYRLTAHGCDLLDGNIVDAGVPLTPVT